MRTSPLPSPCLSQSRFCLVYLVRVVCLVCLVWSGDDRKEVRAVTSGVSVADGIETCKTRHEGLATLLRSGPPPCTSSERVPAERAWCCCWSNRAVSEAVVPRGSAEGLVQQRWAPGLCRRHRAAVLSRPAASVPLRPNLSNADGCMLTCTIVCSCSVGGLYAVTLSSAARPIAASTLARRAVSTPAVPAGTRVVHAYRPRHDSPRLRLVQGMRARPLTVALAAGTP